MRLRSTGVSALLGTAVAVLAAFAMPLPRDDDSAGARHSAVRAPRAAAQRLDTGDAITHGFEDVEPIVTPAAEGLGDFSAAGPDRPGSHPAAVLFGVPAVAREAGPTLASLWRERARALKRAHQPARGRAPPSF